MKRVDEHVRNELLFRAVNERIAEMASSAAGYDEIEVLCECGDEVCITTVVMRLRDYETVRATDSHFVVCTDHHRGDVERIVERAPGYLVVEKVGRAREVVEMFRTENLRRRS